MKTLIITIAIGGAMAMSAPVHAQDNNQPAQSSANDGQNGPELPKEPFENNNNSWFCEGDGFVENHCINTRSQGQTGNIMVFSPDPRGPQESVSTDPSTDYRPCNHDGNADSDGTWWEIVEGLFVCHHRGNQ